MNASPTGRTAPVRAFLGKNGAAPDCRVPGSQRSGAQDVRAGQRGTRAHTRRTVPRSERRRKRFRRRARCARSGSRTPVAPRRPATRTPRHSFLNYQSAPQMDSISRHAARGAKSRRAGWSETRGAWSERRFAARVRRQPPNRHRERGVRRRDESEAASVPSFTRWLCQASALGLGRSATRSGNTRSG